MTDTRTTEQHMADIATVTPLHGKHYYTPHTYGNAADKILDGTATAANIDQLIADCYWCDNHRRGAERQCWHQAAKLLLEHGLHAIPDRCRVCHQHPPVSFDGVCAVCLPPWRTDEPTWGTNTKGVPLPGLEYDGEETNQ